MKQAKKSKKKKPAVKKTKAVTCIICSSDLILVCLDNVHNAISYCCVSADCPNYGLLQTGVEPLEKYLGGFK